MRANVLLVCLLVAVPSCAEDLKEEAKKLQGTWLYAGEGDAKTAPEDERVVIEGDKLTIYEGGKVFQEFTFVLGPAATPKRIDLKRTDGDQKPRTAPAIYELKGDSLKICLPARTTDPRPTEFKEDAKSGAMLLSLARKNR